jgi:hypothetical protein
MSFAGLMLAASMLTQGLDDTGTAIAKPIGDVILEPTTGSYFQVFEFYGRPPHSWRHADRMVRGYFHEGREGKLAHVVSGSVHYFLLSRFPIVRQEKMWIGLQVTCNEKAEIEWVDGGALADQSFRAWNDGTQKTISRTCRDRVESGYEMPIFYDPHELGTRWEAGNSRTNLRFMMVEFQVPKETDEETAGEAEDNPVGN